MVLSRISLDPKLTKVKQPVLIIVSGLDMGEVFVLRPGKMIIGRDSSCDIVLRGDGVSRQHVELSYISGNKLSIRDMGSTNGVFINGNRISNAQIEDGEKLIVGLQIVLKFMLQDEFDQHYLQKMYNSSVRDALTGVFNRRYFDDQLPTALSYSARHKIPFTLLIIDIDHFKKVNDTYGHQAGDETLRMIGKLLNQSTREEDVVVRYGGEEFAIIVLGTNAKGGWIMAEHQRQQLEKTPIKIAENQFLRVTASIGVATISPGVRVSPEMVIEIADKNLYQAKSDGRNRVVATEVTKQS